MDDILIQKFIENFNMGMVAIDLIDLMVNNAKVNKKDLIEYIKEQFNRDFMYGELYDLFKNEISDKKELKLFLENMGHTFVDLEELEEERDKYF